MSWFKRVTGIQELIDIQYRTNILLRDIIQLKREEEKKPELPATKKYK